MLLAAMWLLAWLALLGMLWWLWFLLSALGWPDHDRPETEVLAGWAAVTVVVSALGIYSLSRRQMLRFQISALIVLVLALPTLPVALHESVRLWLPSALFVLAGAVSLFVGRGRASNCHEPRQDGT
jgi:hypothetical protein